jgi:hypothetical protein
MVQRQLDFCHSVSGADRSEQECRKYAVYYCATFFHGQGLNSHCNDIGRVLPLNSGVHHTSSLHPGSSSSRPSAKTTRKQYYCPTLTLSHTSFQPVCHLPSCRRSGWGSLDSVKPAVDKHCMLFVLASPITLPQFAHSGQFPYLPRLLQR